MTKYKIIAVVAVLLVCVVSIAAATANYPTNVYDLPLSRMSRARIMSDGIPTVHPTLLSVYDSYTLPVMPFAYAITAITEERGSSGKTVFIELNGLVNRVLHTNGPGNNSITMLGASDANNYQIKSPVFIPPGTQCRILYGTGWQPANTPLFIAGYALQPGEY